MKNTKKNTLMGTGAAGSLAIVAGYVMGEYDLMIPQEVVYAGWSLMGSLFAVVGRWFDGA